MLVLDVVVEDEMAIDDGYECVVDPHAAYLERVLPRPSSRHVAAVSIAESLVVFYGKKATSKALFAEYGVTRDLICTSLC